MPNEPPDSTEYPTVMIPLESYRSFVRALEGYKGRLAERVNLLRSSMGALLSDADTGSLDVSQERERVEELIRWMNGFIKEPGSRGRGASGRVILPMSHGTVRLIKAVMMHEYAELNGRLDALIAGGGMTADAIEAAHRKLSEHARLYSGDLFRNASPAPLLDQRADQRESASQASAKPTAEPFSTPRVFHLFDEELSRRCLDILETIAASGATDRFDTVFQEATRILESRLRDVAGASPNLSGLDLVSFAFSGRVPKVRLSEVSQEQEAAHLLFRGVFGFLRNPVHHRLLGELAVERALQQLAMIDYLIGLLVGASSAPSA